MKIRTFRRRLLSISAITVVAACAPVPVNQGAAAGVDTTPVILKVFNPIRACDTDLDEALKFQGLVKGLPPAPLDDELAATKRRLAAKPTELDRLRLGLLYALPQTRFRDPARAARLFGEIQADTGDPGVREFAALLRAQNEMAAKRDGELVGLGRRLRVQETKLLTHSQALHEAQAKVQEQTEALSSARAKAELLQQKLNALADIEKNLIRRQTPSSRVP